MSALHRKLVPVCVLGSFSTAGACSPICELHTDTFTKVFADEPKHLSLKMFAAYSLLSASQRCSAGSEYLETINPFIHPLTECVAVMLEGVYLVWNNVNIGGMCQINLYQNAGTKGFLAEHRHHSFRPFLVMHPGTISPSIHPSISINFLL